MEAKNFRIGNYVSKGYKKDSEVSLHQMTASCILDLFSNGENSTFKYSTIPLTEEWLIKFGFKRTSYGRELDGLYFEASNRSIKTDELHVFSYEMIPDEKYLRIEYVHELQNLFFALTGDELKVK